MDIDASFCYYVRRKEKESQIFTLTTVAIFQKLHVSKIFGLVFTFKDLKITELLFLWE